MGSTRLRTLVDWPNKTRSPAEIFDWRSERPKVLEEALQRLATERVRIPSLRPRRQTRACATPGYVLTEPLESEEMTGVWFEIEHVYARPRGRD